MEITRTEISSYKYGTVAKLAREFNVSRDTVYDAFSFKSNSTTAEAIRSAALKYYGARIEKRKVKI